MESEKQSVTQIIEISIRVILGAIFIWAGTMKLLDINSFVESVGHFKFTPFDKAPWDMWIGYMLPAFEFLVGTALILGFLLKGAILSTLTLSVSFLIVVVSAHSRGLNYECGCFGKALSFKNTSIHISILAVMVVMSLVLVMLEIRNSKASMETKKLVKIG